jgi:pimeloyl-ACP methyl ester carboxylesterase
MCTFSTRTIKQKNKLINSKTDTISMNVLFIHGFGGMPYEYSAIQKHLIKTLDIKSFEFTYDEKWGTESIHKLAFQVAKIMQSKKIDAVVGISMGGIIGATAIENYKTPTKVCLTICSPWHGSSLAYLLPFIGARQLRPHSIFLRELRDKARKSKHNYYGVWNPLDLMVFPGDRAKNSFAEKQCKVISPLHPTTFFEPRTLLFCEESLRHAFGKKTTKFKKKRN